MKIRIDIDMTPKELRLFLGLPDVEPLQQEMLEKLRSAVEAGTEGFDPVTLMRPFLAPNLQTMEAMQKAFWQAFSVGGRDSRTRDE